MRRRDLVAVAGALLRGRRSGLRHVVILGSGRSGTSILGELFEALDAYDYRFEPPMVELRSIDYGAGPVAIKVPKDDRTRSSRFSPGLPFDLRELFDTVPEPRALMWIVRHPLDAVCSLRPGIAADWAHNPRPPDFERWLDRPLVERCARHWAYVNGAGHDTVRHLAEVVRYEDLVFAPVPTAMRVLAHAGVSRGAAADAVGRWAATVGNDKGAGAHEARRQGWLSGANRRRVGRWQSELDRSDVDRIRPVLASVPTKFGYEVG
jgi:hypothetical protein